MYKNKKLLFVLFSFLFIFSPDIGFSKEVEIYPAIGYIDPKECIKENNNVCIKYNGKLFKIASLENEKRAKRAFLWWSTLYTMNENNKLINDIEQVEEIRKTFYNIADPAEALAYLINILIEKKNIEVSQKMTASQFIEILKALAETAKRYPYPKYSIPQIISYTISNPALHVSIDKEVLKALNDALIKDDSVLSSVIKFILGEVIDFLSNQANTAINERNIKSLLKVKIDTFDLILKGINNTSNLLLNSWAYIKTNDINKKLNINYLVTAFLKDYIIKYNMDIEKMAQNTQIYVYCDYSRLSDDYTCHLPHEGNSGQKINFGNPRTFYQLFFWYLYNNNILNEEIIDSLEEDIIYAAYNTLQLINTFGKGNFKVILDVDENSGNINHQKFTLLRLYWMPNKDNLNNLTDDLVKLFAGTDFNEVNSGYFKDIDPFRTKQKLVIYEGNVQKGAYIRYSNKYVVKIKNRKYLLLEDLYIYLKLPYWQHIKVGNIAIPLKISLNEDKNKKIGSITAIFNGAGSVVYSEQNNYGFNKDVAIMHPNSEYLSSMVAFQWLYNKYSCPYLNIYSNKNIKVYIGVKDWNKNNFLYMFKYKLDQNGVTIRRPDKGKSNWFNIAIISQNPINEPTTIGVRCSKSYTDVPKEFIYPIPKYIDLTGGYVWTGTSSIISLINKHRTGLSKDYLLAKNIEFKNLDKKVFSSFQWYRSDYCPKLKVSILCANNTTGNTYICNNRFILDKIEYKIWNADNSAFKESFCDSLPCVLEPDEYGYLVLKIKGSIDEISAFKLECEK